MARSITVLCCSVVLCVAALSQSTLGQLTDDQISSELLASAPPAEIDLATRLHENPRVTFIHADLDESGQYDFIVALYAVSGLVRVFREQGGQLVLAGDQEDRQPSGGETSELSLVDLDGSGIPGIEVSSINIRGQMPSFDLLSWTGSSLHRLTPHGITGVDRVDTINADLVDVDGDGVLEIVAPANENATAWNVYKLTSGTYRLAYTTTTYPGGFLDANGNQQYVRAFRARLSPDHFSLQEIQASRQPNAAASSNSDTVELTLGRLRDLKGAAVSVDQIDPDSLVLYRNLRPLSVSVEPAQPQDASNGGRYGRPLNAAAADNTVLRAKFSRVAIESLLPRLQLERPLQPGDQFDVKVRAKLRDGRAFGTTVALGVGRQQGQ